MWENFSPDFFFFLGESRGPKKKIFCGKKRGNHFTPKIVFLR